MSAFAARRAAMNPGADSTNPNITNNAALELAPDEESSRITHPPKKRKTRGDINPLSPPAKPRSSGYWAARNTSNTFLVQKNIEPFDASVVSDVCSINDDEIDDHVSRLVARTFCALQC